MQESHSQPEKEQELKEDKVSAAANIKDEEEVSQAADAENAQANEPASVEEETAALKKEVSDLKAKFADQEKEYLRSRADLENARRRLDKEKTEIIKYGIESFAKDFLPCIDSLDKALPDVEEVTEEQKAFVEGMSLVRRQILDALEKHGVKQVASEGAQFDPDYHQAIAKTPSEDVKEEVVGEVYQEGYTLHERLIRPAMVRVLTPNS